MRIKALNFVAKYYILLVFFNSLIYFIKEVFHIDFSNLFIAIFFVFNILVTICFKGATKRQKIAFLVLVFFYLVLFIRGLLRSNFLPYLYLDLAYFSSFSLILVARSSDNFRDQILDFVNSYERLLYLTLPLAIFIFLTQGFKPPQSLDARFVEDENVGLYTSVNIVYYTIYLVLFISMFRNARYKLFVSISVIFVLLYSLFTLSRGLFIASSISLIYALFVNNKKSLSVVYILKFLGLLVITVFLLYLTFAIIYGFDSIDIILNLLKTRFFDNPDFSGGRNDEEILLMADLNAVETMLGRGFGGANQTWLWSDLPNGMNIVHKWYLHLILKGGYIYLVLFMSIFLFGLINILVQKKYYLIFFFIVFFILSSGHTQFYNFTSISLFWIFLGFGLTNKKQSNNIISV